MRSPGSSGFSGAIFKETDAPSGVTPDERRRVLMTLDITQGALAAPLGRNPRTVRAWFAGDRSIPPDALSG